MINLLELLGDPVASSLASVRLLGLRQLLATTPRRTRPRAEASRRAAANLMAEAEVRLARRDDRVLALVEMKALRMLPVSP